jgi:hypothetical protein
VLLGLSSEAVANVHPEPASPSLADASFCVARAAIHFFA